MRIGYDAKRAFMNRTGLGVYSRNVINSFADFEEIVLFTPEIKIPFIGNTDKVKLITANKLIPRWLYGIWRFFRIGTLANRENLSLYHGLSAELPYRMNRKIKLVLTVHDLLFERFPNDYPLIDRFFARIKAKHACKIADAIIAISETTKNDMMSFYGIEESRIHVIPVPVHIVDCDRKMNPHSKPFIVCVSSFIARKNQLLLIQAFEKIAADIEFDLILIGNGGKYHKECTNYIAHSVFKSRIWIKSKLADDEVIRYYQHALFSVYPSKYEGFGIPIIESIGFGCPILVSDNSTHKEVGLDFVTYFENESLDSLTNAILFMAQSRNELAAKQTAYRQFILERYHPENIRYQISALYKSIL